VVVVIVVGGKVASGREGGERGIESKEERNEDGKKK
jgi:hypothetical protein